MKKQKKKRKLKIGRLFLLLLIVGVISFVCYKFVDLPIRNITITGNKILSDNEIIEISMLEDYPSFFSVVNLIVEKRIEKNDYIEEVQVKKGFLSINIRIKEKKVLYIDSKTQEKVLLDSRINDDKIVCSPYLEGEVPKEKFQKFLSSMNKINEDILCQMSEIKYDPNEIDSDRYYVYMNDGNSVYLTLNKFNKINKYNTILENVGKVNGTLYLDYGDYFETK